MEATIKSKFVSEEILEKRKQMIKKEKLHIQEGLFKEKFENLYNKYGLGFSEKDFAWAFLDIDETNYYNLEKMKNIRTIILSYEYISNEEFEYIRKQVINTYDLKHDEKKSSEEILEMYDKLGGRLSIRLFLEEILGVRGNFFKEHVKNVKINFDSTPGEYNTFYKKKIAIPMYLLNPDYIYELRRKISSGENLHVGDNISYINLKELNKKYSSEMPEITFAQKVIGIDSNSYNYLKKSKLRNLINEFMFQDVNIQDEYIKEINNKIITLHKLKAGQFLQREKFEVFYDKYGGILSKKLFALLVLKMSYESYNEIVEGKLYKGATILDSEEKTDFDALSERIIKEERLHNGDMLKYPKFERIHKLYAINLPEIVFAEKVFGITSDSLQKMKDNGCHSRIHLKMPTEHEFNWFKKEVISVEGIHVSDTIDYKEVKKLYKIYGGVLPIKMFVNKVLGLNKRSFLRIKKYEDKEAFLLFDLEIPNSEIEKIRRMVILGGNLQSPREVSMEDIQELYTMYGSMMSPIMFIKDMLGISTRSFYDLRDKKCDKILACVRPDFNDREVEILKEYLEEGLSDAKIATKMGVTVTFLRRNKNKFLDIKEVTKNNFLYKKVKLLINKGKSPEEILEEIRISEEDLREMFFMYKREEETDIKQKKSEIEALAKKAVDDYEYKEKSIEDVRKYIEECRKNFEKGKFLKKDLYFLEECMIFVQCNFKEIELFSKMCIYFNENEMAREFISENIDNEDIKPEEKIKLNNLRTNIGDIIKKENVLEMLRIGTITTKEISKSTGVIESDVIELQKELNKRITSMMEEED